jgi:hypothetical protein
VMVGAPALDVHLPLPEHLEGLFFLTSLGEIEYRLIVRLTPLIYSSNWTRLSKLSAQRRSRQGCGSGILRWVSFCDENSIPIAFVCFSFVVALDLSQSMNDSAQSHAIRDPCYKQWG